VPKLFSKKNSTRIKGYIELIRQNRAFRGDDFSYEKFATDLNMGMKALLKIHSENKIDTNRHLRDEMELFDLLLLEHLSLLFALSPFFVVKTRAYKRLKRKSYSFEALRTFTWLLNNSVNNLLSIRALLSMGMDLQARVLFRNYIESMDVSIAILLSEEFFKLYSTEPVDEAQAKARWNRVRTKNLLKVINTQLQTDQRLRELWEIGFKMREENYSTTSKGVHVEPIAIMYGAYPKTLSNNQFVQNVGGYITNATKSTVQNIYAYGGFIINFLHPLIEERHNLGNLSKLSRNGKHYSFINQVNRYSWLATMIEANNEKRSTT
jgi:hypothetical protein